MIRVIKKETYKVSDWSGGKTREIFIWPQNGDYASRKFEIRISSATIETPESDFTYLENVKRYLTILKGKVELTINDGEVMELKPYKILEFSGEDKVHSKGSCTDFNLMLKNTNGRMCLLSPKHVMSVDEDEMLLVYANEDCYLIFANGNEVELARGDAAWIQKEDTLFHVECQPGVEGILACIIH